MSARQLMEVALRVLGIWFVVSALLTTVTYAASYSMMRDAMFGSTIQFVALLVTSSLAQLVVGIGLLWKAPRIAGGFYADEEVVAGPGRVGPGDLYHTASYVLGAYFLVQGLEALVATAMQFFSLNLAANQLAAPVIKAGVYTASGLLLIFGARRIAEMLSLLQHDPNSLPRQQFFLKLLLGITFVVAIVLGIARMAKMM